MKLCVSNLWIPTKVCILLGSHIRFKDNVSFDPHAVHCVLHEPSCGEVHLGLLQALHTYIVSFDMPHQLGDLAIPPLQTPTVTVMSLRPIGRCIFFLVAKPSFMRRMFLTTQALKLTVRTC